MAHYALNTTFDPKDLYEQQVAGIEVNGRPTPVRPPTLLMGGLAILAVLVALITVPAQGETSRAESKLADQQPKVAIRKVSKSEAEWQALLTSEQFKILRRAGTEPAFDNRYHNHKGDGNYACAACGNRVFASSTKFDSGTGWPSFFKAIDSAAVSEKPDNTLFTQRTEVACSRCDGHLGHVFKDGPQPTGLRYCINSAALTFFAD